MKKFKKYFTRKNEYFRMYENIIFAQVVDILLIKDSSLEIPCKIKFKRKYLFEFKNKTIEIEDICSFIINRGFE